MTPQQLRDWRRITMLWPTEEAARQLGISHRQYKYLEQGVSSTGSKISEVPRTIVLAVAELRRQRPKVMPEMDGRRKRWLG